MTYTNILITLSISLLSLGGLIAASNVVLLLIKSSTSITPFVGGILLLFGAILSPNEILQNWAALGLFVDIGCLPYLIACSIYLVSEKRRYSNKNKILSLHFEADKCTGDIHLFPNNECIYEYRARDGQSLGSIPMSIDKYLEGKELKISIQQTQVHLVNREENWFLKNEEGWDDSMHSLQDAKFTINKS